MRDIVERLELQAFVADKIQSGMKPLIMDCLEEITHLRCQYEALCNQAEMNARLLTENASLHAEKEHLANRELKLLRDLEKLAIERQALREALKPFAYYASLIPDDISDTCSASGTVGDLRAAAAAIRETKAPSKNIG